MPASVKPRAEAVELALIMDKKGYGFLATNECLDLIESLLQRVEREMVERCAMKAHDLIVLDDGHCPSVGCNCREILADSLYTTIRALLEAE